MYKLAKECWTLLISLGWIPLKWHNSVILVNICWDGKYCWFPCLPYHFLNTWNFTIISFIQINWYSAILISLSLLREGNYLNIALINKICTRISWSIEHNLWWGLSFWSDTLILFHCPPQIFALCFWKIKKCGDQCESLIPTSRILFCEPKQVQCCSQ